MKTQLLNYLIEANIGLVLFFAFYKLLLQQETQFSYRRFYLLSSLLLALLFPLIKLTELKSVPSLSETLPVIYIPEPGSAVATSPGTAHWTVASYAWLAYGLVCGIFAIRLLLQLIALLRLIYIHPRKTIIELPASAFLAFSFFNRIFISSAFNLSASDREKILMHESVHLKKLHSLDILLIEFVRIFLWFNPVLIYYKKEMMQVHEFEADATAVQSSDAGPYCELLARAALQSTGYALGNHFNNSLTLKRITMIRTVKQNIRKWKVFSTLLFAAALFVVISCRDQVMEEIRKTSETTTFAGDFPEHLKPHVERILKENPGIRVFYVQTESMNAEKIKKINPKDILYANVISENGNPLAGRVELIVRAGELLAEVSDMSVDGDIFLVPEQPASPVNGLTAFYNALMKEVQYPEEAFKQGISGKVFVEFVIERDGSLSAPRVVKGIGAGCDEEALRAIRAVNFQWNPARNKGEIVRSKFVVPVSFMSQKNNAAEIKENTETPSGQHDVLEEYDIPASPVEGIQSFYEKVSSLLEIPEQTRAMGISGKVFVEFVVEPDGTASGHRLIRGVEPEADQAVLAAIRKADVRWNPATRGGIPVRSKLVIPVTVTVRK